MGKSTEAEKRAAKKYAQTVDKAGVVLPKGTKAKIMGIGEAGVSQYVNRLVEKDLKCRHRDIIKYARERIQKDIDTCKTVEEWHDAYHSLLGDFREEVLGEADFEGYIESTLGEKALSFFLKNVTIPRFTQETVRYLEAIDDFFEMPNVDTDEAFASLGKSDEKLQEVIDQMSSPEFIASEEYKYLSHFYAAAVVRSEQIEAGIVSFLGQEAFERLVSQGSYDKDNLYYAAMASTKNKARQSRFFVDWLAGRGIFAPDPPDDEHALEAEGWILPSNPPSSACSVRLLLADGAERPGLYLPPSSLGRPRKEQWLSGHGDYSALVIGYKPAEIKAKKAPVVDNAVANAWREVMAMVPNLPEDEAAAKVSVGESIGKDLLDAVMGAFGISYPPARKDYMRIGDTVAAAQKIVYIIGSTGICRTWKVARMARELLDDNGFPVDDAVRFAMTALVNSRILEYGEVGGNTLVRLTKKGIVHFTDMFKDVPFKPSILSKRTLAHELNIASCESTLLNKGYHIPHDHERDLPECKISSLSDIYAEKNGVEFVVECSNFAGIQKTDEAEVFREMFGRFDILTKNGWPIFVVMCGIGDGTKDAWSRNASEFFEQKGLRDNVFLTTSDALEVMLNKDPDALLKKFPKLRCGR